MDLLKKFNKDYYKSSDRRVYLAGKKIADQIEILTQDPDYKEVFELWDNNNVDALSMARHFLE